MHGKTVKFTGSNLFDHSKVLTYRYDMYPPSMLNTYQSRIIYCFRCFFVSFSLKFSKINSSVPADRRILKYMSYRPYTCKMIEAINWDEEESINTELFKMIAGVLTTCHTQYT